MLRQQKNRIKALLLLVVFSINSLAGFACSIGVNMGYNIDHHHKHAKSHIHKNHTLLHNHTHKHVNTGVVFNGITKDDCCSNTVTKFNLLDKSVTDNSFQRQVPFISIVYLSAFFIKIDNPGIHNVKSWFQFVRRSCSLDDTDIRIAIQSFQI
jgi:hypothetical protein